MSLPVPANYPDWQSWASALINSLSDPVSSDAEAVIRTIIQSYAGSSSFAGGFPPDGYVPMWLSQADAELFLGNKAYDPPVAADLFKIDTANIAAAAVATNNLADAAVIMSKVAAAAIGVQQIIDAAVDTQKIADASITTALIQTLAVTTATINDLAVATAKIANAAIGSAQVADAAIGTAQIGDAAIVSALIGDLQVVTAKIDDLAVNNAKIANLAVDSAKIANLSVGTAMIQDLAVTAAKIAYAAIGNAQIDNAAVGSANIQNAAIGTALIQNGAITNALIGLAAISTALIQDGAITNALIGDAQIDSAKISSLTFDRMVAGTLNAEIDVGSGIIKFTIGGASLYLGRGFGTASQFFLWFGPTVDPSAASEGNAVIYMRTDGSAYFGGTLSSGIIKNTAQTTDTSGTAAVTVGPFASNGHALNINVSYYYEHSYQCDTRTGSISGSGGASLTLYGSTDGGSTFTSLGTYAASESIRSVVVDGEPGVPDDVDWAQSVAATSVWTPGAGTNIVLKLQLNSRSEPFLGGSHNFNTVITQTCGIISTEQ